MTARQWVTRAIIAPALLVLTSLAPSAAHAQEMELPVDVQVPLFLKVMTFDRRRNQSPDAEVVVGITFQSGYRNSLLARDEVLRALRSPAHRNVRVVLIDLDRDRLEHVLQVHEIAMLYVSPLRAISAGAVAIVAAAAHVMSVTGVSHYVGLGIVVGVRLQGDRPRLMVNLAASRQCGADFTSELLKLAEVLP